MIFDIGKEPEPIQARLFMNYPGETDSAVLAVEKYNYYIELGILSTLALDFVADDVPLSALDDFLGWIVSEEERDAA